MTEDVGTTKRKPLTPTQRLKMFEDHKGICKVCGLKITTRAWTDEHWRPLGLGGGNEMSNRAPVHNKCATEKTNGPDGDNAKTAHAKRMKIAAIGDGKEPTMQGAKFAKVEKQPKRVSKPAVVDRGSLFARYGQTEGR
jgi:hypothetical protein